MIVYVELALLNNFVISLVLLMLTKRVCLSKSNVFRVIFACIFSSGISLLFPLFSTFKVLSLLLKIAVGFSCVAIAFKVRTFKQLLKNFFVFLGLTLAFGGVVYATFNIFNLKLSDVAFANSPFIWAILGVYILLFAFMFNVYLLAKAINNHIKAAKFIYNVKLTINNKTYSTNAFLDSGNRLRDTTGEGINIVTFKFLSKFLPNELLTDFATSAIDCTNSINNIANLNDAHFVEYSSVGASRQKILVFSANSIEIEEGKTCKRIDNPKLGVMFKRFADSIDYDILLSGDVAEKL